MERIAVLGIGDFGINVARALYNLGDDVLAVDIDPDRVQEVMTSVTKAIVADLNDRDTLAELNVRDIDVAVVAVGRKLETSVLLTHYLCELNVPRILVKVADEDQGKILRLIGATEVIQPERDSAVKTAARIHFPKLVDGMSLSGDYRVVAMKTPHSFAGRSLLELELQRRYDAHVLAIEPAGGKPPLVPSNRHVLAEDDTLVVMGKVAHLMALQSAK